MCVLDDKYMGTALELARSTSAQTAPNPPVGAVVVKDGEVIGFGAHLRAGEAHAEVIALDMAKERAKGATLYTTLEPCSHIGKTPPCASLLIEKEVRRVVIACEDPHDIVQGEGIRQLMAAGMEVEVGVLEAEVEKLYQPYFRAVRHRLPYVTVKAAMSLDGKIATSTGESKWITDEAARGDGHLYRHSHDAILVGGQTIFADDARLTTRLREGKHPVRVILDTNLQTSVDAAVITDRQASTWIFTGKHVSEERVKQYERHPNVKIWVLSEGAVDVKQVLAILMQNGMHSVLVEAGGKVQDAFLQADLIDQLIIYMAPIIIGGEKARTPFAGEGISQLASALRLEIEQIEMLGKQIKITAKRKEEDDVYRDCGGNR